jgi:hypothetical protein
MIIFVCSSSQNRWFHLWSSARARHGTAGRQRVIGARRAAAPTTRQRCMHASRFDRLLEAGWPVAADMCMFCLITVAGGCMFWLAVPGRESTAATARAYLSLSDPRTHARIVRPSGSGGCCRAVRAAQLVDLVVCTIDWVWMASAGQWLGRHRM